MSINQAKDGVSSSKGFFSVYLDIIDTIVHIGGGSEEVMAYLVIARGVGRYGYSTWGVKACATYTEMTHHRSKKVVDWLLQNGFIVKATFQTDIAAESRPRFVLKEGKTPVALANALIEGVAQGKNNPPMKRVGELGMGAIGGREEAQLDVLMVLLHLYQHEVMADYGGVDPSAGLYRDWASCENPSGETFYDIEGTNLRVYEIVGEGDKVFLKFAGEALFYVTDKQERSQRFWQAFKTLRNELGWLYETTQIWTADPSSDDKAEPMYTLYIHDKHARGTDPYLSRDIHNALFRLYELDRQLEFFEPDEQSFNGSGRFRYIADKRYESFPIGIYRLKLRPHTQDTGKGIEREKTRVERWQGFLKSIR